MPSLRWTRQGDELCSFPMNGSVEASGAKTRKAFDLIRRDVLQTDTLICDYEADFGGDVELYLLDCNYDGQHAARWTTRCEIDGSKVKPAATPGFVLGDYQAFQRFAIVGDCKNATEDGGTIGWRSVLDDEKVRADYKIPLRGMFEFVDGEINSRTSDWCIYAWEPLAQKRAIRITNSTIYACRFGIACCGSNSSAEPVQDVLLESVMFYMDANQSQSIGASSSNNPDMGACLTPVVIREGRLRMVSCRSRCIGLKAPYDMTYKPPKFGVPRIAGLVTDQYYSPGQPCDVTIEGCRSHIEPGIATVWNDLDLRRSRLTLVRKEGSGPDGSFKTWSK